MKLFSIILLICFASHNSFALWGNAVKSDSGLRTFTNTLYPKTGLISKPCFAKPINPKPIKPIISEEEIKLIDSEIIYFNSKTLIETITNNNEVVNIFAVKKSGTKEKAKTKLIEKDQVISIKQNRYDMYNGLLYLGEIEYEGKMIKQFREVTEEENGALSAYRKKLRRQELLDQYLPK